MSKKFFRKCICEEKEKFYALEKHGKIKLDLTTNPLKPNVDISKFLENINIEDLHLYPEKPELPALKKEIAKSARLKPENIMLTVGADQGIEIVLTHLLEPNDIVAIKIPTFPRFEIVAKRLCNAKVKFFKNLEKIPKAKVVVLCSPNNPTTEEIEKKTLVKILKTHKDKMFILDAVFSEFGTWDPSNLVNKFDNLIVLESLSKISLAGMRLGFISSSKRNIELLKIGISPFRVPIISQKVALEAMKHKSHVKKTKKFLKKEWEFIKKNLPEVKRKTNVPFFLVKTKIDSTLFRKKLLEHEISVVDGKNFKGLEGNWLRVAIGKRKDNQALITVFKEILKTSKIK